MEAGIPVRTLAHGSRGGRSAGTSSWEDADGEPFRLVLSYLRSIVLQ